MKNYKTKRSTYFLFASLFGALIFSFFVVRNILFSSENISGSEPGAENEGLVYGEEGQSSGDAMFGSENYNVPQIGTGSVVLNYTSAENQWPLEVGETKNEIFSDKKKNYKKLNLAWSTTKPTKCELKYAQSGSAAEKVFKEDDYSMSNSAMIEKLDSASTYNYTIVARDRWGNEKESDKFAVYTGAPELSFLDLLGGALQ